MVIMIRPLREASVAVATTLVDLVIGKVGALVDEIAANIKRLLLQVLSIAGDDAQQRTWCCIQKLQVQPQEGQSNAKRRRRRTEGGGALVRWPFATMADGCTGFVFSTKSLACAISGEGRCSGLHK
jgi:hypothetical protein